MILVRYEIVALTREAKSHDLGQPTQNLLEELQAAALELEDLLDLYEYNQIEKQVSSSSSNCIKEFIHISMDWLRPILPKSSLRIGVEKLLKFVQEVEEKHPVIMSRIGTTQPQSQPNPITPTTSILLSPYFGRENQCDNIIEFLLDECHANSSKRTNKVSVIAIIGMGGSGKSHTAQRISNDDRIKKHFDANMWVHVTRDFDVVGLTRKMLESSTNKICPNFENFDTLQKELIESLSNQKRFLLVLDDVWCEDKMKWDLFVGPLNQAARNGSVIIITTRSDIIADTLNAKKIHLEELEAKDCWSLLKHYAFGNYDEIIEDQELINAGDQIIRKAKHSPLALRVVGSSLSNERSVNKWEKILNQDILNETMDLLLFSYQRLPLHLQRCFAYCSLFPKGYQFDFVDVQGYEPHLISLWIAQGFIENTSELTLEEAGEKYMEELLSYSFFEKKLFSFVIHDLLHDLAENVSKKQCHRIEQYGPLHVPTTCIHLSLNITKDLVNIDISDILKLRNLRSLIIFWVHGSTNIFKSRKDIFQNLTKLRALYVHQQMEVLGDPHIDKLKHLRYLHVRYDSKLPTSLTKLYQLRFFILTTSELGDGSENLLANTLPQGFGNLFNLHILKFYTHDTNMELDYLHYNSEMINIEKLTSLQNLEKFYVDGLNGIIALRNLPLGGSLSILNLENVKCKKEADEAMLNKKMNLNELTFTWNNTPSSIDICQEVLEGLEPHRNLEELCIKGYQGVRFPNWMIKEDWLPRLQALYLESCTSLEIVPFLPPRLKYLYIHHCDELMQLSSLGDTLCYLYLLGCPKLTSLGNLQRCTSLKKLIISRCPMLRREEASLVEGVVEEDIDNRLPVVKWIETDDLLLVLDLVQQQAFRSVQRLSLIDCAALPNLEMFSSLETFSICNCPDVEWLPNLPVFLVSLWIKECPKLKEKYEEGGPLRNTISHIRHIDIR